MFKRISVAASLVLATIVLNGCAVGASPAITEDANVATIKVGRTTKKEVLATFGQPSEQVTDDKGNAQWHYQRVQNTVLGYIPGLNMLGQSEKNTELNIRFNAKGVVTGFDHNRRSL